jgi:biopolymer transport protein ExbB
MGPAESSFFAEFKNSFVEILLGGGILMIPLAVLAFGIYWTAMRMIFFFFAHRFYKAKRGALEAAVRDPDVASGELADIIRYTQDAAISSTEEVQNRFAEIRSAYLSSIDSQRSFLLTLVTVAPLMGLLGTVMGMLTTFAGLAVATGGQTVDQIAAGISEALITTQTGLMIAIPAYVLASFIQKHRNQMDSCLTALETFTVQIHRKELRQSA